MAGNTYLTIDMITREAVRLFKNSNLFIMNMDTQYDKQFAVDGAKIGNTLRIRLPSDFVVNTGGPAMQLQPNTQQFTSLTVSSQYNVATPYDTAERTMSIDDFSELTLAPMINNLAGKVALAVMQGSEGGVCNFTANFDGANNVISPTSDQFLDANAILDDQGADDMDRRIVNSPKTDARTTTALQGLLNPTPEISEQFRSGKMKSGLGYARWFRDQTVISHTSGTYSNSVTVAGGGQTTGTGGGNIAVSAMPAGKNLKKGDIITFGGVNGVNRTTKQSQGTLRQFVVTADVGVGAVAIPVYPGLIPADPVNGDVQYQTVDASPLNGASVTMVTNSAQVYRKSIAYTQKAVTLATADLVLPKRAIEEGSRANYNGIAMRIITDYLPLTDELATRVDVLFGFKYIRPEWLCVVADRV